MSTSTSRQPSARGRGERRFPCVLGARVAARRAPDRGAGPRSRPARRAGAARRATTGPARRARPSRRARRARSPTSRAKTDTQSRLRHAGTTPRVLSRPRVGFSPAMPLHTAGTRPDPAVSVPRANGTDPSATTTAEPELDPPLTSLGSTTLTHAPYGVRAPTRPVANWSRFVLPIGTAPASTRRSTTAADSPGVRANAGQAAVVGTPATSMLSFTANGTPPSGRSAPRARSARPTTSSRGRTEIHAGGPSSRARSHARVTTSTGSSDPTR